MSAQYKSNASRTVRIDGDLLARMQSVIDEADPPTSERLIAERAIEEYLNRRKFPGDENPPKTIHDDKKNKK